MTTLDVRVATMRREAEDVKMLTLESMTAEPLPPFAAASPHPARQPTRTTAIIPDAWCSST